MQILEWREETDAMMLALKMDELHTSLLFLLLKA